MTNRQSFHLESNAALLSYLALLSAQLESRGEADLACIVDASSRFASGSPSEFLNEAGAALEIVHQRSKVLSPTDQAQLKSIIEQIDAAFRQVGGA